MSQRLPMKSKIRDIKQLGINMAVSKIGATVKIGDFLPRAVASTATRSIPHVPMGARIRYSFTPYT